MFESVQNISHHPSTHTRTTFFFLWQGPSSPLSIVLQLDKNSIETGTERITVVRF